MGTLQTVYYRAADGQEPVRSFIEELDVETQVAIDNQIDRLNLLSDEIPHLPFPHGSQVEGELRELRCHYGRSHYRVLYRRSGRLIVLVHVFAKRSAKNARSRSRESAGPTSRRGWMPVRRPPRAAGSGCA